MLLLLTFAASDSMSHALLPWSGKREEEPARVKNKKAFEKTWLLPPSPLPLPPLPLFFFFIALLQPFYSFLFWCHARPNERQWFAWCDRPLPSCSSLEVCVCRRLHVAVCIRVYLQVLMCAGWLPERWGGGRGGLWANRFLTQQSRKYTQICDRRDVSCDMHLLVCLRSGSH